MTKHILATGVVADQMIGQQRHLVAIPEGIAQGLLQRAFKLFAETLENEIGPGAPEFVDGLVGIAHHGDPCTVAGHVSQQQMLDFIGVLILVHQYQIHLVADQTL